MSEPIGPGPKMQPVSWGARCAHLIEVDPNSGCWLWPRRTDRSGYGLFGVGGRKGPDVPVHRASYEHHIGPIPHGLSVLHRCDTPACSNPAHLFLGTQRDNVADRERKGRTHSKLSLEQVEEARRSIVPARLLAERWGVSQSLIFAIRAGTKRRKGIVQ